MKFAEEIFPKGTFEGQQTDGAYIDKKLAANLDIMAKKIAKDMHFLGIVTGNDMVGNGKTTFMTQVGSYLTWKINQLHKTNNTFTDNNLLMNTDELAERSFSLPPLSVLCLDEGDDLTTHGMKALAVKLKRYFRKCRQLNQIIILILPSFFELPKFYALSRSHFLINVKFEGEYDRGFFHFYSPKSKKLLYLKGKQYWDYDAHSSDFDGRFFGSYCFFPNTKECVERYLKKKYEDMIEDVKEEEVVKVKSEKQIEKEVKAKIFKQIKEHFPEIRLVDLSKAVGIPRSTISDWIIGVEEESPQETEVPIPITS